MFSEEVVPLHPRRPRHPHSAASVLPAVGPGRVAVVCPPPPAAHVSLGRGPVGPCIVGAELYGQVLSHPQTAGNFLRPLHWTLACVFLVPGVHLTLSIMALEEQTFYVLLLRSNSTHFLYSLCFLCPVEEIFANAKLSAVSLFSF